MTKRRCETASVLRRRRLVREARLRFRASRYPAQAPNPSPMLLAFGFTQIGMLWWLAAAAAPLLIHLLSRRRYREVTWAAMEISARGVAKCSRRLRFEHWLLLAVRTALIVAIVIAVAGPYVERLGGIAGGRQSGASRAGARRLVFDGATSRPIRSRFEMAKDLIRDLVARSAQGARFYAGADERHRHDGGRHSGVCLRRSSRCLAAAQSSFDTDSRRPSIWSTKTIFSKNCAI